LVTINVALGVPFSTLIGHVLRRVGVIRGVGRREGDVQGLPWAGIELRAAGRRVDEGAADIRRGIELRAAQQRRVG
jgi:hypothetical protein